MSAQNVDFSFDSDAAWTKVAGRRSVSLDTNCWIDMADEANDTACRVRDSLRELVSSGRLFCPLSWGLIEELFGQSGESLDRTAGLMEELSLNTIYVMRTEVYEWEVARSMQRARGEPVAAALNGLFAPVAAFVGSRFSIRWSEDIPVAEKAQERAKSWMKRELGGIGLHELVKLAGGSLKKRQPPAYGQAAKRARDTWGGNKQKLFLEEAGNVFRMYVMPFLHRYSPDLISRWMSFYGRPEGEDAFFRDCLADLPALHNHIEIMVAADLQPDRKDKNNDFFDYELVVAPLAYSAAFVSNDKGIKDLLKNRTRIIDRSSCHFCDGLGELETWLGEIR